jgi:hypothetical protein
MTIDGSILGMKASWKNNKVFFVGDGSEEEE